MTSPPTPLVTVLVCVKDGSKYLATALESLARQTTDAFEVIVVDDASSDATHTIAIDHPAVDRVLAGPGLGLAVARNVGLTAVRTPYVTFLDHDDLFHPTRVERMTEWILSHPDTPWFWTGSSTFANSVSINSRDGELLDSNWPAALIRPGRELDTLAVDDSLIDVTGSERESARSHEQTLAWGASGHALVAKVSDLRAAGAVPVHLGPAEDVLMLMNLARFCLIVEIDQPTYFYRLRDDSETRRMRLPWPYFAALLGARFGGQHMSADRALGRGSPLARDLVLEDLVAGAVAKDGLDGAFAPLYHTLCLLYPDRADRRKVFRRIATERLSTRAPRTDRTLRGLRSLVHGDGGTKRPAAAAPAPRCRPGRTDRLSIWLFPNFYPPDLGGIERVASDCAAAFRDAGHEVTVVTQTSDEQRRHHDRIDGIDVFRFDWPKPTKRPTGAYRGARDAGRVLRQLRGLPVPPPDIIHVHGLFHQSPYALAARRTFDAGLVATTHGELVADWFDPRFRSQWTYRWTTRLLSGADAVTAPSAHIIERGRQRGFNLDHAEIVANGIDPAGWVDVPAPPDTSRVIGTWGRLAREKGFDRLLDVWPRVRRQVPDATLWIAGSGGEGATLSRRLSEGTELVGRLDKTQLCTRLADTRAVVFPSRFEPFGLVGLEALAAGRRVIHTAGTGFDSALSGAGIGIDTADPDALTAAIVAALTEPPAIRYTVHGTAGEMADRYVSLYRRVLHERPSTRGSRRRFEPATSPRIA